MNNRSHIRIKWKRILTIFSILFIFSQPNLQIFSAEVEELKPSDGHAGDYFGNSCSVSDNYAVIGTYPEISSGKAYIFKRSASNTWDEEAILSAPAPVHFEEFGYSVATEGDFVIVGSPGFDDGDGAVYSYKKEGAVWVLKQTLTQPGGADVQNFGELVTINGAYLLVTTPYADIEGNGKAFLYKRRGYLESSQNTFCPSCGSY